MAQIPVEYEVVQRLGNQRNRKFSEVLHIREPNGRESIVKKVRKTAENDVVQERLRLEAGFSFEHPGLPQVLTFHENETEVMLQLIYQPGSPLSELSAKGTMRQRAAQLNTIFPQLVELLNHLHEKNILHLDLKPDNVLISAEGKVSVIDFGMAYRRDSREKRGTLFSLPYAAPELILNRLEICDQRTDYFSLGILIYYFLTSKLPFSVPNPALYTNLQLVHPLPEIPGIGQKRNNLLQQITAKPIFRKPPNQLLHEERDHALKAAMCVRPERLSDWVEEWLSAEQKSLMQRLKEKLKRN